MLILVICLHFMATSTFARNLDLSTHPNWHLVNSEHCGLSHSNRIVGGTDAKLGQYPWMTQLKFPTACPVNPEILLMNACSGAIITNKAILTAAHCAFHQNASLLWVRVGELDENTNPDCENNICAPPFQEIEVLEFIIHERYHNTDDNMPNDIGLIILETPITFNDFTLPVCLPYGSLLDVNIDDQEAYVAGWGFLNRSKCEVSEHLKGLSVDIVNLERCQKIFSSLELSESIGPKQVCAGNTIGQDSCIGDSGGPLMKVFAINGTVRYYIVGIISFGEQLCGTSGVPAVHTRVASYLDWILNNII